MMPPKRIVPVRSTRSVARKISLSRARTSTSSNGTNPTDQDSELKLLNLLPSLQDQSKSQQHERQTAPIFTHEAYLLAGLTQETSQYGVLGGIVTIHDKSECQVLTDPRLYLNTNAPFSALVCGVQGSGKSHTVSVMLESMMIPNLREVGSCEKALAGLVLHLGDGGSVSRPSEAAWVGVPNSDYNGIDVPAVRVYVSRSSLRIMKKVYEPLGHNIVVEPLMFSESELDAEAFLSMMAVGSSDSAPLYMHMVLSILRELGERFSYALFLRKLDELKSILNPAQRASLEQRMSLLECFVGTNPKNASSRFQAGVVTIIDLSDPFIDPAAACGLFEIVTRLFVRAEVDTGKVLVVDEAHKYLSASGGNSGLTKALLAITRQQRHMAIRVVISTQEPTAVPSILVDLCSVTIVHRFSSRSWWDHLAKHVAAELLEDAFERVVRLQTGEAILLAPSGLGLFTSTVPASTVSKRTIKPVTRKIGQFGRRYLLIKTRNRVTTDGGASVMVLGN